MKLRAAVNARRKPGSSRRELIRAGDQRGCHRAGRARRQRRLGEPAECDGREQNAVDLAQGAERVAVERQPITAGAAAAFADVLDDAGERVFELAPQPGALAANQLDGGTQATDQTEGAIESEKRHGRKSCGWFRSPQRKRRDTRWDEAPALSLGPRARGACGSATGRRTTTGREPLPFRSRSRS